MYDKMITSQARSNIFEDAISMTTLPSILNPIAIPFTFKRGMSSKEMGKSSNTNSISESNPFLTENIIDCECVSALEKPRLPLNTSLLSNNRNLNSRLSANAVIL